MSSQHNVFISHRHEDDALIADMKKMLAKKNCDVRDSSITSAIPNNAKAEGYIKSILAARIQWAGKMIVIVSPQTKNHEWVDWEVEYVNKHPDKRIIGVWAPGADQCDLPEPLDMFADAVVTWDADQIIDALNGADNWQQPDGSVVPERTINRIAC